MTEALISLLIFSFFSIATYQTLGKLISQEQLILKQSQELTSQPLPIPHTTQPQTRSTIQK